MVSSVEFARLLVLEHFKDDEAEQICSELSLALFFWIHLTINIHSGPGFSGILSSIRICNVLNANIVLIYDNLRVIPLH